jgi:hypothetical protein
MVYRVPQVAPQSQVPPERRGRVMGHFCLVCASVYSLHGATHKGRPVYGRDHIASTCAHEGDVFAPGESWWEPAVEVLAPVAAAATAAAAAPAPVAATAPPAASTPPPAGAASPAAPPPPAAGASAAAKP